MLRLITMAIAAVAVAPRGCAQTFPSRPVTLIVPFAAGGPSDTIARIMAQALTTQLGQNVLVENVTGAGGTIGIARVARAAPDGHTVLVSHVNHAMTASLYRRLDYRPADDFAPIGLLTDGPMVITARRNFAPNTLAELLAHIRREGDRITIANAGIGSGSHMCGLMLMSALNTRMTPVPYRGTGPAMQDVIAGQVDVLCDQVTSAIGQIRGNQVKAYAVTSLQRIQALDLPTVVEGGLPNFEVNVWHAMYAPRGTPEPIVQRLNEAMRASLRDPTVLARLGDLATVPVAADRQSPAVLGQHLRAEIEKWGQVIRAAGEFAD